MKKNKSSDKFQPPAEILMPPPALSKDAGSKKKVKKQSSSRFNSDFGDEDYQSNLYKPKAQVQSRRRQQSEDTALNEIFERIIDACIRADRSKLFVAPVKKKDAPNYYDVIKEPIDLTTMKNKSKRQEYIKKDQFLSDFYLLHKNAETFNGPYN